MNTIVKWAAVIAAICAFSSSILSSISSIGMFVSGLLSILATIVMIGVGFFSEDSYSNHDEYPAVRINFRLAGYCGLGVIIISLNTVLVNTGYQSGVLFSELFKMMFIPSLVLFAIVFLWWSYCWFTKYLIVPAVLATWGIVAGGYHFLAGYVILTPILIDDAVVWIITGIVITALKFGNRSSKTT